MGKVDKATKSWRMSVGNDPQIKSLADQYTDLLEARKQRHQLSNRTPDSIISQQPLSPGRHDLWTNGIKSQPSSLEEPFITQLPQVDEKSPSICPNRDLENQPSITTPSLSGTRVKRTNLLKANCERSGEPQEPKTTTTLPPRRLPRPAIEAINPLLNAESEQQEELPMNHQLPGNTNLQRWREESSQTKRLPRYIEKIPPAQLELLESDDAWQPPLVGKRSRPGDVPLALLEKLSKAADALSEDPSQHVSPSYRNPSRQQDDVTLPSRDELRDDDQFWPNASDSSSDVDWPSSPPTQLRRVYLPPDSDALAMSDTESRPVLESQHNGTAPPADMNHAEAPVLGLVGNGASGYSFAGTQSEKPTACLPLPNKSVPSAGSYSQSSQSPERNPLERAQKRASLNLERTTPVPQVDCVKLPSPRARLMRNVQIERTPYVEKISSPEAATKATGSEAQTPEINPALPTSSDFVPGTFCESNLKEHTKSSRALPLQDLDTGLSSSSKTSIQNLVTEKPEGKPEASIQEQNSVLVQAVASNVDSHERGVSRIPTTGAPHIPDPATRANRQPGDMTSLEGQSLPKGTFPVAKATRSEELPSIDAQWKSHSYAPTPKRGVPSSDAYTPNKRRRIQSGKVMDEQVQDPAYGPIVQEIQMHRREQFQRFRNSTAQNPPRSSSCSSAGGDNDVVMPTSPRLGERESVAMRDDFRAHTSTPLTGFSDSDELIIDPKPSEEHSLLKANAPQTQTAIEALSKNFAEVYPDYKGQLNDFRTATNLLKKMMEKETAPHPFLFDDAVFHHFHSYRQFLLEDVFNGEEPMTYDKFYNSRIKIPNHLKCVITVDILKSLASVDGAYVPMVHPQHLQSIIYPTVHEFGDHEPAAQKKEKERAISPTTTAPQSVLESQKPHRKAELLLPVEPSEDFESFQPASRGGSPELGTPDIDRSRSPRLPSSSFDRDCLKSAHVSVSAVPHPKDVATIAGQQSPALICSTTPSMSISTTQRRRDSRDASPAGQDKNENALASETPTSLEQIVHAKSSISPSVKSVRDGRSLLETPGPSSELLDCERSSIEPVKKARDATRRKSSGLKKGSVKQIAEFPPYVVVETHEWWKDPDTPLKRFEKQHSALPSEKRHLAGGLHGGINVFDWRR